MANRDGSDCAVFIQLFGERVYVWYRSKYDDLDEEDIRHEEDGEPNLDTTLVSFPI